MSPPAGLRKGSPSISLKTFRALVPPHGCPNSSSSSCPAVPLFTGWRWDFRIIWCEVDPWLYSARHHGVVQMFQSLPHIRLLLQELTLIERRTVQWNCRSWKRILHFRRVVFLLCRLWMMLLLLVKRDFLEDLFWVLGSILEFKGRRRVWHLPRVPRRCKKERSAGNRWGRLMLRSSMFPSEWESPTPCRKKNYH